MTKERHMITFADATYKWLLAECWCGWNIETANVSMVYKMAFTHMDRTNV